METAFLRTKVERCVKEEFHEKIFSEELTMGGVTFLIFVILDLDLTDEKIKITFLKDLRRIADIQVSREGTLLSLTDDEYLTFFNLTVLCILEEQKRLKSLKESENYGLKKNEIREFFGSKQILMHNLSMTSVDALTSDKFGCKF